tara:strand:+ start:152 stop:307 length:156 start_codon:yes stop_codon:yes gene_type:complete
MIKIARIAFSIIAAILIWPIVLLGIVTIIEIALTIGLISALAIWIYKGSKH